MGIRLQIRYIEAKLIRGIGVIKSLATGPPTEASLWMRPAVKSLVDIINAGAGLITGSAASDAYILCSRSRRSHWKLAPFHRYCNFEALDVPHLPEEQTQEPLGALVTRVLYRLRFSGEQRPFDTVSLTYIFRWYSWYFKMAALAKGRCRSSTRPCPRVSFFPH